MAIQRVAVVGAGTMGAGIAQLCLQRGFAVKIHDASSEALDSALERIKRGLDEAVLKTKLTTAAAERAFHSLAPAARMEDLYGADLLVEAVSEDLDLKRRLFERVSHICPDSILATNTSSLPVTRIAQAARSPERVLGMHFFNPPAAMRLVEMVRGPMTLPSVFQEAWDFVLMGLKKAPVDVEDTPGFIVNRVMRPYYLEAQRAALSGCGIAALDRAARDVGQVPMGPFELMDLIGLDVNLAITRGIYEAFGRPERFKPCPLQERLVREGFLGRKVNGGFYVYEGGKRTLENPRATEGLPSSGLDPAEAWERVIGAVISEAELAFKDKVASKADIDTAIKLAMNFPRGPFQWRSPAAKP
ncbi:MAG: 3-hydroxybutyryl-CoA dehydrogenase [Elusimicrobia bacterium]|nr:3-hydroxybutyryl-CoA dehydrogenase [Elusimicrobiota bacterium]